MGSCHFRSLAASVLILFICIQSYSQRMNAEQLYEKAKDGVVIVSTLSGSGSGFLVNKNGYIITNHHVISDASLPSGIKVSFFDGSSYPVTRIVDILNEDSEDLAILKIQEVADKTALPILPEQEARVGSEVVVIGSPLDHAFTIVRGDISSQKPFDYIDFLLQFSAPVNPGNSGGPVLNRNGYVVGCVVARGEYTRDRRPVFGVGFATNASTIRSFLIKNNISFGTTPLIPDLDLKQQEGLTEEERLAIMLANLSKIRQQQQIDSLRLAAEIRNVERELILDGQRNENQRRRDSIQMVEQRRLDSLRLVEERLAAEDRIRRQEEERRVRERNERLSRPRRIGIKVGGGVHHYFSDIEDIGGSFGTEKIYYQFNTMLSYRYNIRKTEGKERGQAFGLFFRYGLLNRAASDEYISFHTLNAHDHSIGFPNKTLELEAGWVLREWFRISGGAGRQEFDLSGINNTFDYYTATTGLVMRFGKVELDLKSTLLFGGFHSTPSMRMNATLNIHLMFGRWRV